MNITLTGFMGTGKTAVGKLLARRLGWEFVDVDRVIEAGAKKSIARIFAEHGEAVFRRLEKRAIHRVMRGNEQVIATGGGAFATAENRRLLRAVGPVICLAANPKVILQRVGPTLAKRPLLADAPSPLARIQQLLSQRASAYARADLTMDTSSLSPDEIVERIWAKLSPCLCRSWRYFLDHVGELSERYSGKYVVVVDDRIVGSGETQLAAYQRAAPRLARKDAGIYYIPLPEESLTAL